MKFSEKLANSKRLRHVIARAITCSMMLLILPSCGIPPLHKPEPGPGLPPSFNGVTSPENSSQLAIEEFYTDPTLTLLIDQALSGNRELKILNEEVRIAANEILARSGAYLPFLGAGAGAGLERFSRFTIPGAGLINDPYLPGKFFPNPMGNFGASLPFTWQLDIYRQLRNARDAAGERYVAASERRNFFVTKLVADVAENYYRLMAFDKRMENINQIIALQEQSLKVAEAKKAAARGTELAVQRFQAELRKNQSEKLIVNQDIVVTENRINFLLNRYPQPVDRNSAGFFDLYINNLNLGVPSQLLQFRPDIRQAERDLAASGLDVKVARVNFYPQLVISAGVGLESFNMRYLFEPQAVAGNIAGGLTAPFINRRAIKAQYLTTNARQLQAVYSYQRVILEAFTEVINRVTMVQNYSSSIDIKKEQVKFLEASVDSAMRLVLQAYPGVDYLDVLFAQRDLFDARKILIETKTEQLAAIVNTYQALGGGLISILRRGGFPGQNLFVHTVKEGETFASISDAYYKSPRYQKALWSANSKAVTAPDHLAVGDKIVIPPIDQLDPKLIEEARPDTPTMNNSPIPAGPVDNVPPPPPPPPPPANGPGPFTQGETKDPAVKSTGGTAPAKPTRMTLPSSNPRLPAQAETKDSAVQGASGTVATPGVPRSASTKTYRPFRSLFDRGEGEDSQAKKPTYADVKQ